jgi:hypothetical protein
MKKKNYQKNYFINAMVILNNVLRMILGQGIPFVYLNLEWTMSKNLFESLTNLWSIVYSNIL